MNDWHLKLFSKSILKKDKLAQLLAYLPPVDGAVCLDLGGDNGIISYFLRRRGGVWHSADLSEGAVRSIRSLVGTNVHRVDGSLLPFPDRTFDLVVIIDFLEHIPGDAAFVRELHRVMKPSGVLIANMPHVKRASTIMWLRNRLGLTDEQHGHLRPGYTRESLRGLLGAYFTIETSRTYSRFFTELLDTLINVAGASAHPEASEGGKGLVITERELRANARSFKLYSALYPFMWLFSRLDGLIFFTRGYKLIARARRVEPSSPERRGLSAIVDSP